MLRKFFAVILAAAMFFSMAPVSPVSAHWADESLKFFHDKGLDINSPDFSATRGECFQYIVVGAFGLNKTGEENIAFLKEKGILAGYPDGSVRPEKTITREEFATLLANAARGGAPLGNWEVSKFPDVQKGRWSHSTIMMLWSVGVIAGYPDGTFGPTKPVTRAEAATLVKRTCDKYKLGNSVFEESPKYNTNSREEENPNYNGNSREEENPNYNGKSSREEENPNYNGNSSSNNLQEENPYYNRTTSSGSLQEENPYNGSTSSPNSFEEESPYSTSIARSNSQEENPYRTFEGSSLYEQR